MGRWGRYSCASRGTIRPRLWRRSHPSSTERLGSLLQNGLNENAIATMVDVGAPAARCPLSCRPHRARPHSARLRGDDPRGRTRRRHSPPDRGAGVGPGGGHAGRGDVQHLGLPLGELVFGSLGFLVSCVDAPVAEVLDDQLGRSLCRCICAETYSVARTQTGRVKPGRLSRVATAGSGAPTRPSMRSPTPGVVP